MDRHISIQLKLMRPLDGQTRFNSIETFVSIGWTQRPPSHAGNLALGIAAVPPAPRRNLTREMKEKAISKPRLCMRGFCNCLNMREERLLAHRSSRDQSLRAMYGRALPVASGSDP